jgi:hypothetical protein
MPQANHHAITIDPTAPFCAARFYQALHAFGLKPYVTKWEGRLGEGAMIEASDRSANILEWAHRGDPDREARRAYVTSAWENRPDTSVQFVQLGAGL